MSRKFATVLALFITAFWGASFMIMKGVSEALSPMAFLTLRFFVASLILFLFFWDRLKRLNRRVLVQGLILGTLLTATVMLQLLGLRKTSVTNAAFITSLSVLIVPFLSAVLLKKLPGRSQVGGLVSAVIGLSLITGVVKGFTVLNSGDFYTFLCALSVAVHILFADCFLQGTDPLLLGICQTFFATLISFFFWMLETPSTILTVNFTQALITAVLLTAVFCTVFAFTGQIVVQKYLPPQRVAMILALEPVFAYLYAVTIPTANGMTESLSFMKVVGCLLIVSGILLSEGGWLDSKKRA